MSASHATAIRIPHHQLAQIDHSAAQHGLTRTDYLIRCATGELPNTTTDAIKRLEALETRVKRLEQVAYALHE